MAHSGKTMTFATDLVPQENNTYNLGKDNLKWIIRGSLPLSDITGADDLKAIESLSGTSGLLKKTAANTWTLDTNTYLTAHRTYTAVSGKKPTGNQTPGFGSTFDIEQVGQDTTGQVSVTERTVKIPDTAASTSATGLVTTGAQTLGGGKTLKFTNRIYPLIGTSAERSKWYKITFPYSTITTGSSAQWFMNSFDLHFGGGYSSNPSGVAHVTFYWTRAANNGAWTVGQQAAFIEGTLANKIGLYYRITEPGILYVNNTSGSYNGIWMDNLFVDDSSTSLDWSTITITNVADITESTSPKLSDYTKITTSYLYNEGGTLKTDGNFEGKYIKGTWLYTSAATAKTSTAKLATIESDNFIYYITPANALKSAVGTTAIGADKTPIYWNGSSFAAGTALSDGAYKSILNNTSKGALGWNSAGNSNADNLRLINVNTLAYWNGAYSGTSSNLSVLGTVTTGTWNASVIGAAYGGTGQNTLQKSANVLINALGTGSSDLTANDYVITQYVGGGTTTTSYHRRPASKVVNTTLVKAALGTVNITAKKFLKDTGAWTQVAFSDLSGTATNAQLANSKVTIAGNVVNLGESLDASTLTESLGLSKAMRFIGVAANTITDGGTQDPGISDYSTKTAGDVVIDSASSREYVWSTTGKWELLGGDSSYKTTQTAVTDPTASSTTSTTFIDTISQDANGVITATKKTLPAASSTVAGITKIGASGGAAAYSHTHSYLANTNTGAADRPIYITGNAAAQTTYRMAGTNTVATTGITYSGDLDTGIWYVTGISGTDKTTLYNQADGVIIANKYSTSWISEIYQDYRTGQLAIRGKNNGTWATWRNVLDSTNYTDYTVTKTGSGASGTWNIAITGKAGSVDWANTGHPSTFPPTIGTTSSTAMAGNTTVTNVAIGADTTTNKNYALVFGTTPSDGTSPTAAKTEGLQKNSAKFYVNPSTGALYATKLYSGGTEVSVSGHTHNYLSSISWSGDTNLKLRQSVNGATATDILQFAAGSNITLTGASGKLTIAGTPDTKNTAGSTNSTSKLFLIGATTQAANPTTNSYQYTYATEGLLSSTQLGLNAAGTEKVHLEWNATDSSLDFVFA